MKSRILGCWIRSALLLALALCGTGGGARAEEAIHSLQYVWIHPMTTKSGESCQCVRTFKILEHRLHERFEVQKLPLDATGRGEVLVTSITIEDTAAGTKIWLDPAKKVCTIVKQERRSYGEGVVWAKIEPRPKEELIRAVRLQVPTGLKQLPETTIDGRRAIGFVEVDKRGNESWTTTWWVEPQTKSPFHIDRRYVGPEYTGDTQHRDIVINPPLEESLFDMTPPAGYRVEVQDGEASE